MMVGIKKKNRDLPPYMARRTYTNKKGEVWVGYYYTPPRDENGKKIAIPLIAVAGAIAGIISAIPAIKAISVPMEIPKSDNLGGNQNEISENGIRHSVRPQTSIMKARRY